MRYTYLVIGLRVDDIAQSGVFAARFADTVQARDAEEAEKRAGKLWPDVTIAAVINEAGEVVS